MDLCSYVRKNTLLAIKGGCICTPLTPPKSATDTLLRNHITGEVKDDDNQSAPIYFFFFFSALVNGLHSAYKETVVVLP